MGEKITITVKKEVLLTEKEIDLPAYFKHKDFPRYIYIHDKNSCVIVSERGVNEGSPSVWIDGDVIECGREEFLKAYTDVLERLSSLITT